MPDIGRPLYRVVTTLDASSPSTEAPPTGAEGGSNSLQRWTRTQRIRTAAAIPVEATIVDQVEAPVYLKLGDKAKQLRELGMSDKAIARALGVSDKTVAKAIERARNT